MEIPQMSLENTKDLNLLFSQEKLNFLKNVSIELSKLEKLIENNQQKQEKYSLFINTLISKNFSNTNKQYYSDVKNIYSLLEKNQESLKTLKNLLSNLSTKLLSLILNNNDTNSISLQVNEINDILNHYIYSLEDLKKDFVINNVSINTFSTYHSTKLLLTTFEIDLGEPLNESINLFSPNTLAENSNDPYSDLIGSTENQILIISEKERKVYLPYKKNELKDYMSQYPTSYYSYKNVIEKEFIKPLNYFMNSPNIARFRETYSLYRDREASSPFESLQKAITLAFKSELNPAIIAACKTKKQLNNYLLCLSENKTNEFTDFKIIYDINPAKTNKI